MTRTLLQRVLPALVSVGILVFVFWGVDVGELREALSWRVVLVLVPAFLAYGAATLWIEAIAIERLLSDTENRLDRWTTARIKCASYLLGIVNYALGVGALTVLLQRRAGIAMGRAASVVLLITSADILVVLGLAGLATLSIQAEGAGLRLTLFAAATLGFAGGLALLRTDADLGPLERMRNLSLFAGLRVLPLPRLVELFALRLVFSGCFVSICAAGFFAFDVHPPLATLVAGVLIVAMVGALPIAIAGIGTSQAAFVYLFPDYAPRETLLAMSIAIQLGMIALRGGMGLLFAREFTQEALRDARSVPA
jgi:uncharacterized membrane protein YbhN (UPF0104 family)